MPTASARWQRLSHPAAMLPPLPSSIPTARTLPPLSMGQPQANAASGSQLQQPSFQGSLVSAAQQPSFARATSHPPPGLPAMDARKRVKAESASAMSAPGASVQSAGNQSSGSMLAPSAKRASSSKAGICQQAIFRDAQTCTEDSSRHTALRQTSPLQADYVTRLLLLMSNWAAQLLLQDHSLQRTCHKNSKWLFLSGLSRPRQRSKQAHLT